MKLAQTFVRTHASDTAFITSGKITICRSATVALLGPLEVPFTLELNDEGDGIDFLVNMTGFHPMWFNEKTKCSNHFLFSMDEFLRENLGTPLDYNIHKLYLRVVPNE